MVALGRIECLERRYLRYDRIVPQLGGDLADRCLGLFLLTIVVVENGTAILRADIITLSVQRRRVVCTPEHFEDLRECDLRRIKMHLDHFGMPCCFGTDLPISGMSDRTTGISRLDLVHTFQVLINGFHAPETAPTQRSDLQTRLFNIHFLYVFCRWR